MNINIKPKLKGEVKIYLYLSINDKMLRVEITSSVFVWK